MNWTKIRDANPDKTIVVFRGPIQIPNAQVLTRLFWRFPDGTRFAEILVRRHQDQEWPFEIRVREKANGKWVDGTTYRPLGTVDDLPEGSRKHRWTVAPGRLAEPYQFLDRAPPASYAFRVLDWEAGEIEILPRHSAVVTRLAVLRLYVTPEDKPAGPHYWDVTARRLVALLGPVLPVISGTSTRLVVTVTGQAPATEYQLAFENP